MKIAFSFLAIILLKLASSKLNYFSCNSKKGERTREPLVRESCKQHKKNPVNRDNLSQVLSTVVLDVVVRTESAFMFS